MLPVLLLWVADVGKGMVKELLSPYTVPYDQVRIDESPPTNR